MRKSEGRPTMKGQAPRSTPAACTCTRTSSSLIRGLGNPLQSEHVFGCDALLILDDRDDAVSPVLRGSRPVGVLRRTKASASEGALSEVCKETPHDKDGKCLVCEHWVPPIKVVRGGLPGLGKRK